MTSLRTIFLEGDRVNILDQTRLPGMEVYLECTDHEEVARAIEVLAIRGAPAIGVAAAMGITIGAGNISSSKKDEFLNEFDRICLRLAQTRPTAKNLFWAIDRMKKVVELNTGKETKTLKDLLRVEAELILEEDIRINQKLGDFGAELIPDGAKILTHCNAGALATGGYGTALGVMRSAVKKGKEIKVFVDETRPLLQGARLTAWELKNENIPYTLITDNMAGYFMQKGMIDLIVVGADRIAANGDTANKIGTYGLAVLAKEHGLPFYIAAPFSTIDISIKSGEEIPVEERGSQEVTHIMGNQIAPEGTMVMNPAFDVTPNEYITAIITENGIKRPPFELKIEGG